MKFEVTQEALLKPLQLIAGVVERRKSLPVLSNLLLEVDDDGSLKITGTDQEVELSDRIAVLNAQAGEITVPARKLLDICRSQDSSDIIVAELKGSRLFVNSGRFKSQLATLPATEFPNIEAPDSGYSFDVQSAGLKELINNTSFAMAQQDVRYFFNGLLLEIESDKLQAVATNGQRMALDAMVTEIALVGKKQLIVPKKAVVELARFLADEDLAKITISPNYMVVKVGERSLTTKLLDATYPDYRRAIPEKGDKLVRANKRELRDALARTAILTNEMYRSIHFNLSQGSLNLEANNPDQEEAEETIAVVYEGEELQVAFNVGYLLDVLAHIGEEEIEIMLSDAKQPAVVHGVGDTRATFVVSPMVL